MVGKINHKMLSHEFIKITTFGPNMVFKQYSFLTPITYTPYFIHCCSSLSYVCVCVLYIHVCVTVGGVICTHVCAGGGQRLTLDIFPW